MGVALLYRVLIYGLLSDAISAAQDNRAVMTSPVTRAVTIYVSLGNSWSRLTAEDLLGMYVLVWEIPGSCGSLRKEGLRNWHRLTVVLGVLCSLRGDVCLCI